MPANTAPIYTLTPDIVAGTTVITANTATDGTGTVSTAFTAGANGSYVKKMRIKASGSIIATVLRVFLNNGQANSVAANNTFYDEISLSAVTGTNTAATQAWELPLEFALPNAWKINVVTATTVANNIAVTVIGGDY